MALDHDARLIIMEQVFRKLALKFTFRLDVEGIKIRLFPHELMMTMIGDDEVLIHLIMDWIAQIKRSEDTILL